MGMTKWHQSLIGIFNNVLRSFYEHPACADMQSTSIIIAVCHEVNVSIKRHRNMHIDGTAAY
jgi:hypothetical protein